MQKNSKATKIQRLAILSLNRLLLMYINCQIRALPLLKQIILKKLSKSRTKYLF